jgi:hypothetical protein
MRAGIIPLVLAAGMLAAACESPTPPAPDGTGAPGARDARTDFAEAGAGPAGASEASKVQIGYAVAPVPLDLEGKNPALVGLGSYIANVSTPCSDCHSNPQWAPGGNPYLGQPAVLDQAGYLRGGSGAFGPFTPRNLTPNAGGLPAGLTLDEFLLVLNTGADLKQRPPFVPSAEHDLLQVMPWPLFRHMPERDKRALYEYLRAIPCQGSAQRCGTGD